MGKVVLAVFGLLTFSAVYLTTNNIGVMEPSITKASVRQGSAGRHIFVGGGGHRVK
jgi:hypothetical protein